MCRCSNSISKVLVFIKKNIATQITNEILSILSLKYSNANECLV